MTNVGLKLIICFTFITSAYLDVGAMRNITYADPIDFCICIHAGKTAVRIPYLTVLVRRAYVILKQISSFASQTKSITHRSVAIDWHANLSVRFKPH